MTPEFLQDCFEWDVPNWSKASEEWSKALKGRDLKHLKVLCIGERNGGLSLWFASQGSLVICTDLKEPTIEAKLLHEKYGVSDKVSYSTLDVFKIPYPDASFDVVAAKSVIGGLKLNYKDTRSRTLENQRLALNEIKRVLRSDGLFLGAENMRASIIHQLARKLLKGKKIGWRHFRVAELHWILTGFSSFDISFYGFLGTKFGNKTIIRLLTVIDRMLSRVLPDTWLYIAFIVCRK